ncbi:MAG: hypothetical protein ABSB12_03110 [Candidatus Saccharimonadales bacterium]
MSKTEENFGTFFINLTPEQREDLDKLGRSVAADISNSPNKELPIDAFTEQGSIKASRDRILGILVVVVDQRVVINLDGKNGEVLQLTELGQTWLDIKHEQVSADATVNVDAVDQ